jgi:hypothetical protein
MDEHWEFFPDHTGKVTETGPFGYPSGAKEFEWKEVADFTIACRITRWIYDDEDEQDEEIEEEPEEGPEEWQTVRYGFKEVPTDCGDLVALCEVESDGTLVHRFWHSAAPLSYNDEW